MNIEEHLPQFEGKRALILVSGKQCAEMFFAKDGEIELIETLEEPKMQYTDTKEGAFRNMGARGVSNIGAPYEEKDEVIVRRFLNKISERIEDLLNKREVNEVILFSPEYIGKMLEGKLPSAAAKVLKYHLYGNYIHHHPFDILEMIKQKQEDIKGESVPRKREARKLLEKEGYS